MVIHSSRSVFMVPGWFLWYFKVPSWLFMVPGFFFMAPGGFLWFFMVPGGCSCFSKFHVGF